MLGMASMQTWAVGFVSLPASGFPIEGGTSAYTLCNPTGNFGVGLVIKAKPGANDQCAVFPANEIASPLPGFKPLTVGVQRIVMNNALTGGRDVSVGNVTEFVWRNAEKTECIYGVKVMTTPNSNADYNAALPGKQYFKVNDLARGGFSGLPVEVAYSSIPAVAKPLYRVGRTFTSVQYRGTAKAPAPGYLAQPPSTPAYSLAINGIDSEALSIPLQAQQSASPDDNWVNFTTYITAFDEDGSTSTASGMFYVKSACSAELPAVLPDAIRLRQTVAPFIELGVPGFVPPGGKVTPLPDSYEKP
ncbi:hypothetical protein MTYP_02570 [Methylophilaceae bacterium]|nr:hypothetical protein MTYP_02570 [Methylophilaceae bacterium]